MVTFACSRPNRDVPNCIRSSSRNHKKHCSQVKHSPAGGGLPYLAYAGMCRWTGYGWTRCLFGLEAFQRVWRLAMSGLHLQYQEPMAIPIIFFLNIYFHDLRVKNYLILYAKQSKSGSESSVSCLKQGSEMKSFCLKQGRGLRASAAHLKPNFPWVPVMGSHFHDWIGYNGVAFSIKLLEWGRTFFGFLGVRQFFIFTASKRARMFVLQMKTKAFFIQFRKWVNS